MDYQKDLAQQLMEQGLPVPDTDLFPIHSSKDNGQSIAPGTDPYYPRGRIVGLSFTECEKALLGHYKEQDVSVAQAQAALHEFFHHVYRELNLEPILLAGQAKYPEHMDEYGYKAYGFLDYERNLSERFADGASILHILSNRVDDVDNAINCWVNHRTANLSIRHNTLSTIQKIISHFSENPQRGLNCMACAQRTIEIMNGQDLEMEQYKAVAVRGIIINRSEELDPLIRQKLGFSITDFEEGVRLGIETELRARENIFRGGPLPQRADGNLILWNQIKPAI